MLGSVMNPCEDFGMWYPLVQEEKYTCSQEDKKA